MRIARPGTPTRALAVAPTAPLSPAIGGTDRSHAAAQASRFQTSRLSLDGHDDSPAAKREVGLGAQAGASASADAAGDALGGLIVGSSSAQADAGTSIGSAARTDTSADFSTGLRASAEAGTGAKARASASSRAEAGLAGGLGRAGADSYAGTEARAELTSKAGASLGWDGLKAGAEAGAEVGVRAQADARGEVTVLDGMATGRGEAHATGHATAGAKARAETRLDLDGLHAQVGAGVKAEAEARVEAKGTTEILDGAVRTTQTVGAMARAEASAEARVVANVGLDENQRLAVEIGADAHARAVAEARAWVAQDVSLFGFTVGAEGYASAKAGAEAGIYGMLTYKDGKVRIGGGAGAAAKVGAGFGGGVYVALPPAAAALLDTGARVLPAAAMLAKNAFDPTGKGLGGNPGALFPNAPAGTPPPDPFAWLELASLLETDGNGRIGKSVAHEASVGQARGEMWEPGKGVRPYSLGRIA